MTLRDQLLRGDPVVGVLGPMRVPPREAIVRAVRTIAAAGPHTRVALGFDPDAKFWRLDPANLEEWCEEVVVSVPPVDAESVVALANRQAWLLDAQHPLRIVLAGDYIIQVNDHALGDGVLFVDRLAAIISLGTGARTLPEWVRTVPAPHPLRRAVRHTLAHRGAVAALIAERRADRAHVRAHPAESAGVPVEWRPEMSVVATRIPATRMAGFKAAARETTATLSASLVVALRRALNGEGVPLSRDPMVIYNLRRYLPDGESAVSGNFVSGLLVRAGNPNDPVSVSEAMRVQIESARPLAALVVGVVKAALVGVPSRLWRSVGDRPSANLVFNNLGRAETFDGLPWTTSPDDRTCAIITRPGGPEDVTILMVMVSGVLHVTASFHSNVLDEAAVGRALDRFAADPVSLLRTNPPLREAMERADTVPGESTLADVELAASAHAGGGPSQPVDADGDSAAPRPPASSSTNPVRIASTVRSRPIDQS
jgi:hypothetical protein